MVIAKGELPALDAAPGEAMAVTLDEALPWLSGKEKGDRRVLRDLPLLPQRRATLWAPAGYEVGWSQLATPVKTQAAARAMRSSKATESAGNGRNRRRNHATPWRGRSRLNRASGVLSFFGMDSRNLLFRGPQLNLWRAATDNDGIKLMEQPEWKVLPRWLALGLPELRHRLDAIH